VATYIIPIKPRSEEWWNKPSKESNKAKPKPPAIKQWPAEYQRPELPPLVGSIQVENNVAQANIDEYIKRQNENKTVEMIKRVFEEYREPFKPSGVKHEITGNHLRLRIVELLYQLEEKRPYSNDDIKKYVEILNLLDHGKLSQESIEHIYKRVTKRLPKEEIEKQPETYIVPKPIISVEVALKQIKIELSYLRQFDAMDPDTETVRLEKIKDSLLSGDITGEEALKQILG